MRVVVLRALKLGDFLTGVPAFRAVRRAFPGARITLAAPLEFTAFLDLIDFAIDDISRARELDPLDPALSGADVGIDLHGKGPESHRLLLALGVGRLIAFRNEAIAESADGPAYDVREHEVARWCRLLEHHGIPTRPDELHLRVPPIEVPHRLRGATLIHHGASSEARCWPVERWIAVARRERERGRAVILTGSRSEAVRATHIARAAGISPAHVYAGRTTLRELAALVAAAGRVVCGDTGIGHLASAYGRPSVLLFGPTEPSRWGPPPLPQHRVLWNGTTGDPHAARIDPGLQAISVGAVLDALDQLPPF